MTEKRKKLMEVAEACKPKPKAPPRQLTRDETFERIGELKAELATTCQEIRELKEILEPLQEYAYKLQEEKWRLEATIAKVTKVSLKAVRQARRVKSEREELLDTLLSLTPEQAEQLKKDAL